MKGRGVSILHLLGRKHIQDLNYHFQITNPIKAINFIYIAVVLLNMDIIQQSEQRLKTHKSKCTVL